MEDEIKNRLQTIENVIKECQQIIMTIEKAGLSNVSKTKKQNAKIQIREKLSESYKDIKDLRKSISSTDFLS